jgi:hypothetical protein
MNLPIISHSLKPMKLNKEKEWAPKSPTTDAASESQNFFGTQSRLPKTDSTEPQHCEIYPHHSPNCHQ